MKKLNKKQQSIWGNGLAVLCLALMMSVFSSCNKEFPNTLREEYPNDTTNIKEGKRKVLYLILDGVRGSAVSKLAPPAISQIVRKSIYNYDGLVESKSTPVSNGLGWANSLTGVNSDKHKVISNDFANNQLSLFPTIFTRFKQQSPSLRTASIAATNVFNTNLAIDATAKVDAQNDDAKVKDAVIAELGREDAGIVVAQFHSADEAGIANGYTDSTLPYTNAILQIDTYIDNIITALQARKTYSKEDWLVVITSNKGGFVTPAPGDSDLGAFGEAVRNTFTIFYNPKFSAQFIPKPDINSIPFSGFAPRLISTATTRNILVADNNTTIGDFGTTGDFTVIFKVRADHASVGGYPPFIGKTLNFAQNNPGWVIFTNGSDWNFKANGTQQLGGAPAGATRTFRDGIWHSIALRIYTENGSRYVKGYQDGKLAGGPLTSGGGTFTANMSSATPLTIGNIVTSESTVGALNVLMREVAIYNVAMPEETLLAYMRKTQILPTDPNYANLIAYWPGTDGSGLIAKEKTGKAPNLKFLTTENWTSFLDSSPNLSPPVSDAAYSVVINNVDIPTQIYQWMRIAPPTSWNLDGKIWKLLYTDVRNN